MKNELGINYCAITLYSWHAFVYWFLMCGPLLFKDKVKPVLEVGVAENDACNITQK